MILQQPEFKARLERINRTYFADPARWITVPKGEYIVRQGESSRRLYLIRSGHVIARRRFSGGDSGTSSDSCKTYEIFRAGPGAYIGVQSFFSKWYYSSSDIMAGTGVELAYIDDKFPTIDEEQHGSLLEQFVPTIIHELALRNLRVFATSVEKEEALRALHRSEMAATLGELSAGLAHELNNSIGVLARKIDFVEEFMLHLLAGCNTEGLALFKHALDQKDVLSSGTLRSLTREYEDRYGLSQSAARILAHIAPDPGQAERLDSGYIKKLRSLASFWEAGSDIRDMKLAARHASNIVRSVKLLGNASRNREESINIIDSLSEAVSLLKSDTRGIAFDIHLPHRDQIPSITGNLTEFVQIWVNIIKNACEAMKGANTPYPRIILRVKYMPVISPLPDGSASPGSIQVEITDTGPGVPEDIREKIFRPSFTTRKKGLSFGLGLGLAIVRRIVDSYDGTVTLNSSPGRTTFTVTIPTT